VPDFDPISHLGFGFQAMEKTWSYVSKFLLAIAPFLFVGAIMFFACNSSKSLYDLKLPARLSISNLKQTE